MRAEYESAVHQIMLNNQPNNKANPLWNKIVPDAEYDFFYSSTDNSWHLTNKQKKCSNNENNNIIVVLESPHKDEFNVNGDGLLPLFKDLNFNQYLGALINGSQNLNPSQPTPLLNTGTIYKVYLVNAIQLQCSLGIPTEYYRDLVFLFYWDRLKSNFETRLKSYINDNTIAVINLCTQGRHECFHYIYNSSTQKMEDIGSLCDNRFIQQVYDATSNCSSLQDLVQEYIEKVIVDMNMNIPYTTGTHPSIWHDAKKRIIR